MVERTFDTSIQNLENNIKTYVQTELSAFFKEQQNIYEVKKLMEHDFVKNIIIENRTLKNENDKLKQKINIITKNIPNEYPNDEPNVFWEVIEKNNEKEEESKNNDNLPKTYKENKKMVHIDPPNNYYLMGQDGYTLSSDSDYSDEDNETLELSDEELVYKESINAVLEKYNNVSEEPTYINIGLTGMDIHSLESQCQKYEIEDKFYHIILDLAKKNYASFSSNKLEDIPYTQVLGLSAGLIKWALLNGEEEDEVEEDEVEEDEEDEVEEDEEEEEETDELVEILKKRMQTVADNHRKKVEREEDEEDEVEEDEEDEVEEDEVEEDEVEEDEVEEDEEVEEDVEEEEDEEVEEDVEEVEEEEDVEEVEEEEDDETANIPPLIQGALLAQNTEPYVTIDSDSEEEEEDEDDEEALEVEEYILQFEGKKTKTYKDDDGYIYQYLDDEDIGDILGQLKDGIFIAS